MTRPTLIMAALLLLAVPAQGETQAERDKQAEYHLLAETICAWETQGELDPQNAIGLAGEIGWCQMKPRTAKMIGVLVSDLVHKDRERAVQAAIVKLKFCAKRGWHGTYWGAHCYNGGPWAKRGDAARYAKQIAILHAPRRLHWLMERSRIRLAQR